MFDLLWSLMWGTDGGGGGKNVEFYHWMQPLKNVGLLKDSGLLLGNDEYDVPVQRVNFDTIFKSEPTLMGKVYGLLAPEKSAPVKQAAPGPEVQFFTLYTESGYSHEFIDGKHEGDGGIINCGDVLDDDKNLNRYLVVGPVEQWDWPGRESGRVPMGVTFRLRRLQEFMPSWEQ